MNIKHKPQNSSVKFEDICEGQEFAITLNPLHNIGVNEKYSAYLIKQHKLLLDCVTNNVLRLYPEISPIGRIHFHGYVYINDIVEWGKDILKLMAYGTVCIKKQFETEEDTGNKWHIYCLKQQSFWEKALKGQNIRYPLIVDIQHPFAYTQ